MVTVSDVLSTRGHECGDKKNWHVRFTDIKARAKEEVAMAVIGAGIYRLKPKYAEEVLGLLSKRLTEMYGVPYVDVDVCNVGTTTYVPANAGTLARIRLKKVSVLTFLSMFRKHMQVNGKQILTDAKEDEKCWSHSLFANACPGVFMEAWTDGKLYNMAPLTDGDEDCEDDDDCEDGDC